MVTKPDSQRPPEARLRTPLMIKIGVAIYVVSLVWWLVFYAQYGGVMRMLDVKILCLTETTFECTFFRDALRDSPIPAYSPYLWWAGTIAVVIGVIQVIRQRRHSGV